MDEKSVSLKMLKTKGLAHAQSSRLYIFYYSDPRSHWVYRKSQYYQGGMRCCLMSLLLQVLSDMLQKPSTTFSYPHMSQTKSQTRPHRFDLSGATEFIWHSHCRNPNQFGLTDGISVSPRWACKFSVTCCNKIGPTEFVQLVKPRWGLTLTLAHRSHRVDHIGPTKMPNSHIMNSIGPI